MYGREVCADQNSLSLKGLYLPLFLPPPPAPRHYSMLPAEFKIYKRNVSRRSRGYNATLIQLCDKSFVKSDVPGRADEFSAGKRKIGTISREHNVGKGGIPPFASLCISKSFSRARVNFRSERRAVDEARAEPPRKTPLMVNSLCNSHSHNFGKLVRR